MPAAILRNLAMLQHGTHSAKLGLVPSKTLWLALVPCVVLSSEPLCAQAAGSTDGSRADLSSNRVDDVDDEVIVRGRRLADFRAELDAARVRVYDLFNELNSDDAFDVHCHIQNATGTRMRHQSCRPQFQDDISSASGQAWVRGIRDACGGQLTQECIFSEAANQGISAAQAVEAFQPGMQQQYAVEMARVVAKSPEMQQAILDYEAVERAYDEARGRRRCDQPDPPSRCSR
jgi:hypothetical protein